MTGIEEPSIEELLKPFFKLASTAMFLLSKLLPPDMHLTLIARHDDFKLPIVVSEDDLQKLETAVCAVNRPENQDTLQISFGGVRVPAGKPN